MVGAGGYTVARSATITARGC